MIQITIKYTINNRLVSREERMKELKVDKKQVEVQKDITNGKYKKGTSDI